MESLLVAVTVISLGLAVTMSAVAWSLIKAERQRAAARIEALEALAFIGEPERPETVTEVPRAPSPVTAEISGPAGRIEGPPKASEHPVQPALQPQLPDWDAAMGSQAADSDTRPDVLRPIGSGRARLPHAMFDTEAASNAGTRRLLAVAAIGLLIAAGYATASAMRAPRSVAAVAMPTPATERQPLELLSLRHSTDSTGVFAVSGFVQNPTDGRDLTNVEAVIYLFDSKDQYFTTGRAPLETSAMRPGTDSAFEVHIPNAVNVSRYRVGFRQADGTVVSHVDRRGHFPDGSSETVLGGDQVRPAGGMR
jgi:hypothetical protein